MAAAATLQTAIKERRVIFFMTNFPPKYGAGPASSGRSAKTPVRLTGAFCFFDFCAVRCVPHFLGTSPLYRSPRPAATMGEKNPGKALAVLCLPMKRNRKARGSSIAGILHFPGKSPFSPEKRQKSPRHCGRNAQNSTGGIVHNYRKTVIETAR